MEGADGGREVIIGCGRANAMDELRPGGALLVDGDC